MHTLTGRFLHILILICGLTSTALTQRVVLTHPLNLSPEPFAANYHTSERMNSAGIRNIRMLAVMVQFQLDSINITGKGRFDNSASSKIIDPPPHNREYFNQHITFVQNYFRKVSKGKVIITGGVLDSVYTLSNKMRVYSPPRGSTNNIELGNLAKDTWQLVDTTYPGINFDNYDAFVIFHAGAGHDIDFVSIYGYDPTPFDIPSIYIGLPSFKNMFGVDYQGISVRHGSRPIANTMILPETEDRQLSSVGGNFLLQLGINGLFAASIGSYLGLPDLFDTKTGKSGIGRFGLMDGQSIFSWNGVFPPEPSAWERFYLGWVDPVTISRGDSFYTLPAAGFRSTSDSIYRVSISEKEYFLVENRNRDAHHDGAKITVARNSQIDTLSWTRDTTAGFNAFDQDSLWGVVTDVDEFDWSLPGGVDNDGNLLTGGLLIWHIDQNVIDQNFATNTINANPDRRGVNLMEADGSQDIGQTYGMFTAGSGSEDGTPFDFWYRGNSSQMRAISNEFTPTSFPNTMSNDGANSHITMKNFTIPDSIMGVRIEVGDSVISPFLNFPRTISNVDGKIGNHSMKLSAVNGVTSMIMSTPDSVYGWHIDGSLLLSTLPGNGLLTDITQPDGPADVAGDPIAGKFNAGDTTDIAILDAHNLKLQSYSVSDRLNLHRIDTLYSRPTTSISTPLIATDSMLVWGDSLTAHFLRLSKASVSSINFDSASSDKIVGISPLGKSYPASFVSITAGGWIKILTSSLINGGFLSSSTARNVESVTIPGRQFTGTMTSPAIVGYPNSGMGKRIMFASKEGAVFALDSVLNDIHGYPVSLSGEILNSPVFADIDGDGVRDIIVFAGNKIYALNAAGAILNHFPITTPTQKTILSAPVIADVNGDGNVDIVAVTQEGLVVAYDRNGTMINGFPLFAGLNSGSTPALFMQSNTIVLTVAADDGRVYAWKTGTLVNSASWQSPWTQKMRDAQNSNYEDTYLTGNPPTNDFFPASSAYNWPNPVGPQQNYLTHIRYFLGQSAAVNIKIFDMAGDIVQEITAQGSGGMDNEVVWDVSNIQSGVYFAHIQAQGNESSGVAIVKIAVIK
ncbi:MAG: T9SS type A sorting domain-containing protein [Bacteroidota bacterium]